jgi:RNA polymerase sigma factor (sigma-70 family)
MHTSASAIAEPRRPHARKLSQAAILHQSDERLVALARSGSERAWAEITRRYGRQLRVYCARFVGASRAEDAVQQTFLQAFLALRDGSNREIVLRAWLYRIAHNCSIDLLRKGTADYDELDLEFDGVAQPPTLFEQREEIRALVTRMRALPEAQRQALALRELEGRSYEEISAQLGHSGSGVRQLIFRARTALRNSAAGLIPSFSLLKHHLATAVSVPASSGTGAEAVGAATLAVVAVLGGGLAASDGRSRPERVVQASHGAAAPVAAAGGAVVQAAASGAPAHSGGSVLRGTGRNVHVREAAPVTGTDRPGPATPESAPAPQVPEVIVNPGPVEGDAPALAQTPVTPDVTQQSITTADEGSSVETAPPAKPSPAQAIAPARKHPGPPSRPAPAAPKPTPVSAPVSKTPQRPKGQLQTPQPAKPQTSKPQPAKPQVAKPQPPKASPGKLPTAGRAGHRR